MFYHNKIFYNEDYEMFIIPDQYTNLVHESQSDSTKIFFDNFASDMESTVQWIKNEMNVNIEDIITKIFSSILEKI